MLVTRSLNLLLSNIKITDCVWYNPFIYTERIINPKQTTKFLSTNLSVCLYVWIHMHICTVCQKKIESPLFISRKIIVMKWNWCQSSWITVYFTLMLWIFSYECVNTRGLEIILIFSMLTPRFFKEIVKFTYQMPGNKFSLHF